jgi:integrase
LKTLLSKAGLYPVNGGVFEKLDGKNYSTSTYRRWLKKAAIACDVENGQAKTHGLRHRFAKNFNTAKGDIFMLADIMGHRSTETTRKCSEATLKDQRTAIQQTSNMARKTKLANAA